MAGETEKKPPLEPLATLTNEAMGHLDDIQGELDKAEENLNALEEIGIDASRMRERIDWAKKARTVILKQFGPKQ